MLATLSKELKKEIQITLDSIFISDYMPFAPENHIKVYLYGLMLASGGGENSEDEIAKRLGIDTKSVVESFKYWETQGILNIISQSPLTVEYLPITKNSYSLRKFSKSKYKDFNDQLHAMFPNRNILPAEYNEYYSVMEELHIEPTALLAVIAYCIRQKGETINYPYILAVARNLAYQGCLTYDRVSEQLSEFDLYDKDLSMVYKGLGIKKSVTIDDKRLLIKWTKTFGFGLEVVIQVAKNVKKGGMDKLDSKLTKYYENHLFTVAEIDEFNKNRDNLYELTKNINRIIGVYYEQLDYIIETYTTKWLGYGFDDATLLSIAEYCFKANLRTLDGMNQTVERFYKQGLITNTGINTFIGESVERDNAIRAILEAADVSRPIVSRDRDAYRTWTHSWSFSSDILLYAAGISKATSNPVSYMNGILAKWYNGGVKTLADAKAFKNETASSAQSPTQEKSYSSEELNAMFDNLEYEDL